MIVASLYNLPLTVLKSSASASVADRSAKIASVVAYSFTLGAFCLLCSPHGNDFFTRNEDRSSPETPRLRRSRNSSDYADCQRSIVSFYRPFDNLRFLCDKFRQMLFDVVRNLGAEAQVGRESAIRD